MKSLRERIEKLRDGGVDGLYDVNEILTELDKTIAEIKKLFEISEMADYSFKCGVNETVEAVLKALDSKEKGE